MDLYGALIKNAKKLSRLTKLYEHRIGGTEIIDLTYLDSLDNLMYVNFEHCYKLETVGNIYDRNDVIVVGSSGRNIEG